MVVAVIRGDSSIDLLLLIILVPALLSTLLLEEVSSDIPPMTMVGFGWHFRCSISDFCCSLLLWLWAADALALLATERNFVTVSLIDASRCLRVLRTGDGLSDFDWLCCACETAMGDVVVAVGDMVGMSLVDKFFVLFELCWWWTCSSNFRCIELWSEGLLSILFLPNMKYVLWPSTSSASRNRYESSRNFFVSSEICTRSGLPVDSILFAKLTSLDQTSNFTLFVPTIPQRTFPKRRTKEKTRIVT